MISKTSIALATLFLLPMVGFSQDWTLQNSGTNLLLHDIVFVDGLKGWAVGRLGTIIHTTDGGDSWSPQVSGTVSILHSVSFVDSLTGWVAGEPVGGVSTILHTTDGGNTWNLQTGIAGVFYACHFVNRNTGWAVGGGGGTIYHTSDGGATWALQHTELNQLLFEIHFLDDSTGYVAGQTSAPPRTAKLWSTTNGGTTWTALDPGAARGLQSAFFTDYSRGWAVGWLGEMIRTTDGGATWLPHTSGRTDELLFSVFFNTKNSGWVVGGESGCQLVNCDSLQGQETIVLRTTDAGSTWGTFAVPIDNQNLTKIYFSSPDTGWIVGGGGTILRTTNGTAGSMVPPGKANLLSPSEGSIVVPDSVELRWSQTESGVDVYWVEYGTDSLFLSSVIDSTVTDAATTAYSLLGGSRYWWRVRAHNPAGWGPFSETRSLFIHVPGFQNIVSIDAGGGGYTDLSGNVFGPDQLYVAGGFGYTGGSSRQKTVSILGTEDDPLYQTYRQGTFRYRFDFGNGLYQVTLHFMEPTYQVTGRRVFDVLAEGVVLLNDYDIVAVSGARYTARTESFVVNVTDGQLTLNFSLVTGPGTPLVSALTIDAFVAKPSGHSNQTMLLPEEMELYQNYPNPFNPSTTIRYGLNTGTHVTLKIYNTLGEEVASLVNEWQEGGYKSVNWNGRNNFNQPVSSGMYFYRIESGEFVRTMKMIVVK